MELEHDLIWPFSSRKSRSTDIASRRTFQPRLEDLEGRALPSLTAVPINTQVLAYARAHLGQDVGNGECTTLAQFAVQSAGGVPFYQLGPGGPTGNYVWGTPVATLTPSNGSTTAIAPGDILQFSNVVEVSTVTTHYANGASSTYTYTQWAQHHTAIVGALSGNGSHDIQVYQANFTQTANEPLSQVHADQTGTYWGGTSSITTNYPQNGYSVTVTHSMTAGTIQVYQPYKLVTVTPAIQPATAPVAQGAVAPPTQTAIAPQAAAPPGTQRDAITPADTGLAAAIAELEAAMLKLLQLEEQR
jgi:hypothetical protein